MAVDTMNEISRTEKAATYITKTLTSKDGTPITYRQLGKGSGVVLLHGAMESAGSHLGLARALADRFTVYLPERRGHSFGFPFEEDYGIEKEVEDLEVLLAETCSSYVFGVSAGGLIALQAALKPSVVRKAAVYEPALIVNHSISMSLMPRYDRELAEGNLAAALITGMKAARLGPPIFGLMPRRLLESFTAKALEHEGHSHSEEEMTLRKLAPTLHYDFKLVAEMAESVDRFRKLRPEVLLLGGSKSPSYLKAALDALERIIPQGKRIEFPGLDHSGSSDPSKTNPRGGRPELVAEELRRFFT